MTVAREKSTEVGGRAMEDKDGWKESVESPNRRSRHDVDVHESRRVYIHWRCSGPN
jgi:hypothetical protein